MEDRKHEIKKVNKSCFVSFSQVKTDFLLPSAIKMVLLLAR